MNLADLQKLDAEQKKKLALAAILGVLGVYGLVTLVITPTIESSRRASSELTTLRGKLDKAQSLVSRESRVRELMEEAAQELGEDAGRHIPPLDNPLSWVAGQVYGSARTVGVDIESVSDLGVIAAPWQRSGGSERAFVPYAVRIVTECGYRELVGLMHSLEASNPYLCITEIQVIAQDNQSERHKIRLTVQWPYWSSPEEAMKVTQSKGADRG